MDSTERTTNECESPRISFSLNLSQNDRISPDNRKREDVTNVHYDTDFEFCVVSNNNYRQSFFGVSVTDGLFPDGKILPADRPIEAQPMTIANHLSLQSSSYQSPVRSASFPPEIRSSCLGIVAASKSSCHKPPSKWKEIILKLSNKENAESRKASSSQDRSGNNVKQRPSSPRSTLLPFSRSCSTDGGEMKRNALFCLLPFSRSQSTAERKHKTPNSASCYSSHPSPRRIDGNERSMVQNLERSSADAAKATSLDSPRSGKPMFKSNSIGRVSPVLNVVACIGIGHVGGNWKGSGGLFGYFPKREKKQQLPSAYYPHQSHASTNSKKGA